MSLGSHIFNPSDELAKIQGAPIQPLIDLLMTGMYHLKTEEASLADRAAEKEATGRTFRKKDEVWFRKKA